MLGHKYTGSKEHMFNAWIGVQSGKSEFPSSLNRCELAKVQWEWSHLQPLPSWSNRLDTQGDILGVICNFQLGGLRFALCMCACLCPSFGRYTEIKANAGDPDQDCGKIVTIEGISGFGRNPTRVRKPARRHSQNLHVQTFANLRCGLCWSMPREQLWISCEPPAAALSWMNFYFAGFDLLTHQWQISSYTLHILHFHRHDIRQMESKPCFEVRLSWNGDIFSEIYRFPWNRCFQESVWLIVDAPQAITIESFLGFQLLPCCQLFPLVARQECLSSCTTWPPITF